MGPTCIPKMPLGFLRREEARQTRRMEGGIHRVDGVSTEECYLLSCLRHSCLILSQLAEDHSNDSQEGCHRTVKKNLCSKKPWWQSIMTTVYTWNVLI